MSISGLRFGGGAMAATLAAEHTPPVGNDGQEFLDTKIVKAITKLARRFFTWIGDLFSSFFSNSKTEKSMPEVSVQKADETPIKDEFLAGITSKKHFSYQVGEESEIQRYDDQPHVGSLIERNQGKLKPINGTNVYVMREVDGYINEGLETAGITVIGPNGQEFNGNTPQERLELIASAAGKNIEEAFDGLSKENPVSIFQAHLKQHFNAVTHEESEKTTPIFDETSLVFGAVQNEKSILTIHPNQGDGALRYRIEEPYNLATIDGTRVEARYIISQEVTIHPGGQVDIERQGAKVE